MIVGLVGFIGSGKGTVGNLLADRGYTQDSFAAPLKDAVANIFGWPRIMLEGDTEMSRKWREEPDTFWSEKFGKEFTPRLALQLMGTEAGREVFHNDLWVISLLNRSKGRNTVVTDVRFKNEVKYIQQNGGLVIRVKRGAEPVWFDWSETKLRENGIHQSEWDWIGCDFDWVIENDGTIDDLGKQVDKMLHQFGL
jgi:hypothetical protein